MNTSHLTAYGFQIDDNSFFLRDIARNGYRSLFDCFYMAMLRDWHRRFGARITLNCYYRTADGFTLDQFPDRYRAEWAAQADWLRLTFHADADLPDFPYRHDTRGESCTRDFDRVRSEIVRFAGESCWAPPSILHWVAIPRTAWPVLTARGVTSLAGLFAPAYQDDLKFNLPADVLQEILTRGYYRDPETGITVYDVSIVCNNVPPEQAEGVLNAWTARCPTAKLATIWTHEQYFWNFYKNYLPDHPKRVERALQWAMDRKLKPVFIHDYPWDKA